MIAAIKTALWVGLGELSNAFVSTVPHDTAYPYFSVVYNGGGETNQTPTPEFDVTFLVKCVSDSQTESEAGADTIRDALREADLADQGSYKFYRCQVGTLIAYGEQVDGVQIYHNGYMVRVRGIEVT